MKIEINKLVKQNVFHEDFCNLEDNNVLDFGNKNIVVIYGPNGTGKTSFSNVLRKEKGTQYEISYRGNRYTSKDDLIVHTISDQNGRNIIEGETQDFILGDNIKREYELKTKIEESYLSLFKKTLPSILKKDYNITTKNTNLDKYFKDENLFNFVSDIANTKSKGKNIAREDFVQFFVAQKKIDVPEFEEDKMSFFITSINEKNSSVKLIVDYEFSLNDDEKNVVKIEENNEAISILNKFSYLDECLICDSDINSEELISKKERNIEVVSKKLTPEQKELAGQLISGLPLSDPFKTRDRVREAIAHSDRESINRLVEEFRFYAEIIPLLITNQFIDEVDKTGLITDFDEYSKLIEGKLEFENDDILFIEKFLSESLDRPISLERDEDHNIKLLLGGEEFLNKERVKLALSNGEQNFLSLAFELLKAKNAEQELIILDDPISSFDSIYKNKLAFAIIKFLSNKKSILLTHNTDLVKLLEHQVEKCFNLYYFNNTFDEVNGFVRINESEVEVVLYIHKLLELFRRDIKPEIIDERKFLVSVAPFLRGYCQIVGRNDYKNDITKIMHGYNNERINLSKIYNDVIGENVIEGSHHISAKDIIAFDVDDLKSIKSETFSLLEKTLRHSLTYLLLRLKVEADLVLKFNINTNKFDMLTQIITKSFNGRDKASIDNRVFFMSRKTLLNEFNHFDMDMNFFQPAIDITNKTLDKEKVSILERLDNL
ncbi:hypothetical protein [Vibrio parahaemolyticus]|uniref:hypothetical protein n=1 Tax=Vibrio parahaemolyticus TaxID=670 RepID=UPI00111FE868|nr:hypothetical protein [Vibrio parahaemolyticus]TOR06002.1 hypothetical protein CGG81_14025 [Vibrio parahaemolyticus]